MKAAREQYDVIVVGGGVYGIMIALEASLRKQRVLLLERDDWGGATTSGWLRILHGGLRYLQTADLPRFFESVSERRWFLRHFPEFSAPLPCLMPLYSTFSHSPFVMRAGLALNDLLSIHRNRGVDQTCHLPAGRLLDKESVVRSLEFVETDGLRSGACWFDGVVTQPQRLLLALLRWCEKNGVKAENHSEVVSLLRTGGRVEGVQTRCPSSGDTREYLAPIVINASGHWAPELASRFGLDLRSTPQLSWAWSILFDIPSTARHAAAVSARRPESQMLFILPWQGRTVVGTGHKLAPAGSENTPVPGKHIAEFIHYANEAVPRLQLSESKISRVFQGMLPASRGDDMELASRPLIIDHDKNGMAGLFSVWGVKFTTARAVAEKVVTTVLPGNSAQRPGYDRPRDDRDDAEIDPRVIRAIQAGEVDDSLMEEFLRICRADAEISLDDLLIRRCGLSDYPANANSIGRQVADKMPWDESRRNAELERLNAGIEKLL